MLILFRCDAGENLFVHVESFEEVTSKSLYNLYYLRDYRLRV